MARQSKIITIDGIGEVTVKEVTPYAVYQAFTSKNKMEELRKLADECIDLPKDKELWHLYPSESEQIVDGLLEVNKSFFTIADKVGIKGMVGELQNSAAKILPELFASSLSMAIGKLGSTDGNAS